MAGPDISPLVIHTDVEVVDGSGDHGAPPLLTLLVLQHPRPQLSQHRAHVTIRGWAKTCITTSSIYLHIFHEVCDN